MRHVNISSAHSINFMFRQTPKGDGCWEEIQFHIGSNSEKEDWLIVIDQPARGLTTALPKSRRMVFLTEPLSIKRYDSAFLDQFAVAFSMSPLPSFKGDCRLSHSALPWFYGIDMSAHSEPEISCNWRDLVTPPPPPEKKELLSAICSTKALTSHQVKRLYFLERLKEVLGQDLALFGRGFSPIDDKAQGLQGYRYHLVLENNDEPYGWTEKMADCILAGAYPIVAGNVRLELCFDPLGYTRIDLSTPLKAVKDVQKILLEDPASSIDVKSALAKNKKTLMMKEQFFPMSVAAMIEHHKAFERLASPIALKAPKKTLYTRLKKRSRPLMKVITRTRLTLDRSK